MSRTVTAETSVVCDREWRVEDLDLLPEGYRCELLDGVLYMVAMPAWRHGVVIQNLQKVFIPWLVSRKAGFVMGPQTGLQLNDRNYIDPDLVFLTHAQAPRDQRSPRTATLVVEVVSPSNLRASREERETLFRQLEVPEIWYIDPVRRTLEVRELIGNEYVTRREVEGADLVTSPRLKGLEFALEQLWEDLPPTS